jgi:hypothetical protein
MCKSISKSLAKLFCKGKYIKFVKKYYQIESSSSSLFILALYSGFVAC